MVAQHYRWDFVQLSTDEKPTPETSDKVTDGSTLYTSDDSKYYIWYKDQWYEKEDKGGGGGDTPSSLPEGYDGPQGEGIITSYNTETGVISGTGFTSKGNVWMLDRDTNTYNRLDTSAWSDTSITLATPIDSDSFEGNTSIVVEDSNGNWTTKLLVFGSEIQAELGYIYYKDSTTGEIVKAEVDDWSKISPGAYLLNYKIEMDDKTFYSYDIVGVMIKSVGSSNIITYFMANLPNLNQPLYFPSVFTSLPNYSLYNNSKFNQPIIFEYKECSIGGNVISQNGLFNQPLDIEGSFANYALTYLFNFNQSITLKKQNQYILEYSSPKEINLLGIDDNRRCFMELSKPCVVNVGSLNPPTTNASSWFTYTSDQVEGYIKGITIKGANRQAWLTAMPNSTTSPYRHLIDGGE